MSDRRRLLSRPRTKVYDCNYNIGERYYKPTLDSLDRKYSGRSNFSDEATESPARRAAKLLDDFDSKATNGTPSRSSLLIDDDEDIDDEFSSTMKRIKAARAARASSVEDEFDSFTSRKNALKQKPRNFAEKVLESVGLNDRTQKALEDDIFFKKKTLRSADDEEGTFKMRAAAKSTAQSFLDESNDELAAMSRTRKTRARMADLDDSTDEMAAMSRARKSRARLADLESEMEELAERGVAREKRLAGLRALISENESTNGGGTQESIKVKRVVKTEKKVTF